MRCRLYAGVLLTLQAADDRFSVTADLSRIGLDHPAAPLTNLSTDTGDPVRWREPPTRPASTSRGVSSVERPED